MSSRRSHTATSSSPPSLKAIDSSRPWRVSVADGPDRGALDWSMSLPAPEEPRETLTIGRAGGTGTVKGFDDKEMSRRHASFVPITTGWALSDAGSKNGVSIDGSRIPTGQEIPLKDGAVIRLGATLLVFERQPLTEPSSEADPELVGRASAHLEVLDHARTVAATGMPVLILGETGTGKELTTRHIHRLSGRRGELVSVNCAAIPANLAESLLFGHRKGAFTGADAAARGYFDTAQNGTLFLDEIGELSAEIQAKLLRVLESSEYMPLGATTPIAARARIIAATNVDLREAAAAGTFRKDLYARLAAYPIRLPPLRHRKLDIPLLFRSFIEKLAPEWDGTIEASLLEQLMLHDWPMNIRELQTVARQLMLRHRGSARLRAADLPPELLWGGAGAKSDDTGEPAPAFERVDAETLRGLLRELGGKVSDVAKRLGRDRAQIYRWLKKWDISLDDYR